MCGIAGVVTLSGEGSPHAESLASMLSSIAHRGPDSSGTFVDNAVALGCRRLRINDLTGGDQPLFNEDGSVVLVCNGEIFNYDELRRFLLAKGHTLQSRSDVEVLLHLYEELGPKMLDRVEGQFAFVLYDAKRKEIFAARDRFGVCPFFYTIVGDALLFASEIKAFLSYPGFEPRVDVTGLDQVLCFPGLVSPRTMFRGVRSLPPGHTLTLKDGQLTTTEYWDLNYPLQNDIDEDYDPKRVTEDLLGLLESSIQRRMRADVPVGVYLSGGLDSSLIACLMKRLTQGALHTFSITFPRRGVDESVYQRFVARKLSSEHHASLADDDTIVARLRQMISHAECPVKESYNTCSMMLAASARESGVPVVLCGDGADELFFGYPGYRLDARGQRRGPSGIDGLLEAQISQTLFGDEAVFYERSQIAFRETKQGLYSHQIVEALRELDACYEPLVNAEKIKGRHPLHQRSYLDLKLRLADHLLADHGDRMAMAHSVEPRFPFLDRALVEYLRGIPPNAMLANGVEKALLKEVARGVVPDAIVQREKFGFVAEGSPGLLARREPWVMELLSPKRIKRQGYFNPDTVAALTHRYSQPGFRLALPFEDDLLMIVLSFNLFLECFQLPGYS